MNSQHWVWVQFTGYTDALQSYYNKNEADEPSAACEARFRSHEGTMWLENSCWRTAGYQ